MNAKALGRAVHDFPSLEPGTRPICGSATIWVRGSEPKETTDEIDCKRCLNMIESRKAFK